MIRNGYSEGPRSTALHSKCRALFGSTCNIRLILKPGRTRCLCLLSQGDIGWVCRACQLQNNCCKVSFKTIEMVAALNSSHFNFLKQYGASRKFQCLKPVRKEPTSWSPIVAMQRWRNNTHLRLKE